MHVCSRQLRCGFEATLHVVKSTSHQIPGRLVPKPSATSRPWIWQGRDLTGTVKCHAITHPRLFDGRDTRGRIATMMLAAGPSGSVQYRPTWDMINREKEEQAVHLLGMMEEISGDLGHKVPLFINNEPWIIETLLATGIQYPIGLWLGKDDFSYEAARNRFGDSVGIGFSPHDFSDAVRAYESRAVNFLGLHMWPSKHTKRQANVLFGTSGAKDIAASTGEMPIVLVGGVSPLASIHWRRQLACHAHRLGFAAAGFYIDADVSELSKGVETFKDGAQALMPGDKKLVQEWGRIHQRVYPDHPLNLPQSVYEMMAS